ncbi:rRNA maturation RNase YbeY [Candidatus Curtissbacteria bacterium RIFCSPHIGHO2_01_FULL_41_11]|uniref:rRNA maturation RNase YbeY n=1 Tax=Candidatus Curtissbacteria bacterium RIFCSPHIGHO2_01_FULL_41_11 TaxID=1797711 RepID=A0A1F5G4Z5_9BACT|nr:MAG: rRNA maturation RNase YbeY [Candidatus Curtissbacteria bacterium RIFCSPHIGHO2_01_FULL_41_11]
MVRVLITTESQYPIDQKVVKKAIFDTLKRCKIKGDYEISVLVAGKKKMLDLSRKYLKDNSLHEVLAFSQEESGGSFGKPRDNVLRLGDVVLCWPEVLKCASCDGVETDDEVYLLTTHAVLHLLGEHHD